MKKTAIFFLSFGLLVTFCFVQPASARPNGFWPGVAIGVGSAIVLGHLFQTPRVYYYHTRPAPAYYPPSVPYHPPAEPVQRGRWVPGHWVEGMDRYGNYERYWVPEHWERIY